MRAKFQKNLSLVKSTGEKWQVKKSTTQETMFDMTTPGEEKK